MKRIYFLTAYFENQFGKALKYYDGDSWHWMLNSDKPKIYKDEMVAKKDASVLSSKLEESANVYEVNYFVKMYEHKVLKDSSQYEEIINNRKDVSYEIEQRKEFIFLSTTKQTNESTIIDGLYCVNRKEKEWIYCGDEKLDSEIDKSSESEQGADLLIAQSHQKLEDAKAMMMIFGEEEGSIKKIESVITFVKRIMDEKIQINPGDDMNKQPNDLIKESYELLDKAKFEMVKQGRDKQDIGKVEGVKLFVQRLI